MANTLMNERNRLDIRWRHAYVAKVLIARLTSLFVVRGFLQAHAQILVIVGCRVARVPVTGRF